jgi:hypothetical protein
VKITASDDQPNVMPPNVKFWKHASARSPALRCWALSFNIAEVLGKLCAFGRLSVAFVAEGGGTEDQFNFRIWMLAFPTTLDVGLPGTAPSFAVRTD